MSDAGRAIFQGAMAPSSSSVTASSGAAAAAGPPTKEQDPPRSLPAAPAAVSGSASAFFSVGQRVLVPGDGPAAEPGAERRGTVTAVSDVAGVTVVFDGDAGRHPHTIAAADLPQRMWKVVHGRAATRSASEDRARRKVMQLEQALSRGPAMPPRPATSRRTTVVCIGESDAGKTSLLQVYKKGLSAFDVVRCQPRTLGVDYLVRHIDVGGTLVKVTVFDTAGRDTYARFARNYYRGAHAFVAVYDITDRRSLERLFVEFAFLARQGRDWRGITIIVGNKRDRETERQVPYAEGEAVARVLGAQFVEASAKTGENVEAIVPRVVQDIPLSG